MCGLDMHKTTITAMLAMCKHIDDIAVKGIPPIA